MIKEQNRAEELEKDLKDREALIVELTEENSLSKKNLVTIQEGL